MSVKMLCYQSNFFPLKNQKKKKNTDKPLFKHHLPYIFRLYSSLLGALMNAGSHHNMNECIVCVAQIK